MKSIKLLFLAPSFALSVFSLAELAKADPTLEADNNHILTVGELRSQASQQSASLLQPNLNSSHTTKPETVAQIEPDSDEIEIEVTGKKSPFIPTSAPAYVVPKEEIQKQNPSTAAELLRSLPGFAINDYGFGADIHTGTFLRGFSINQSTFQINGRSFGSNVSTYHGGTDLNSIPVDAIERVELTGGTSATLYGSEAFGGVINLITKKDPQPLKATTNVELGSYGYQRYRVGYGGTLDGVNFRLGYERFSTDNNYPVPIGAANRNPTDGRLFNGDSRIDNFYGSVEAPINARNSFSIDAYKSASRRGLLYFGFPLQRDRLDHDLLNIGATLTSKLGEGDDSILKTTIAFNQDFFNTYGPTGATAFRSGALDSRALSGRVEHQWQLAANNKLTWGFDVKTDSIRGDVLSSLPALVGFNGTVNRDRSLVALFALNAWKITDDFQLELGLRQNFTSDYGSYLNPTIGTRWNITPELAFRNSFAVLQRNPGLDQLFVFDTVHNWLANPNLIPERGVAYTAGFDLSVADAVVAQLTYFGSSLSDRIGIIAGRWENVGQVNTNGVEAGIKWKISPEFSSFVNYTYTDAKIASSRTASEVGLQLATVPYSVGKLGVSYESNGWQANLFFNYYSGSRRAIFAQGTAGQRATDFSPAYLSLDFSAKVPLSKNLALTVNLENLTDNSYEKTNRIYQPGLTYRIGLQASF
ncbi:TonB-dependent receptor [Pseudanabaena sp. FACHB-1277]|uniref:TonB-dependent receptor n=1 Tax=Pseudanabaena cinerea FACHB-1277 TaxID=2949581 RepID=A0A926UQQ3_9CYAN|nr:TonB-dependent receptor [Pseudanabaena cinerea]MBD2148963.1 TonB-dependent receptor [Pseudanabaena cinerea FACHB-1277]